MIAYKKLNTEVAVIGGGLTGTVAAFELAKAGYSVTIIRDGRGASPHVAGFNVAGAEAQDNADTYIKDSLESGGGQADPALVELLCCGSTRLPAYLDTIGFSFDTDENGNLKARKSLGSSFARVVGKGNSSGAEILSLIDKELKQNQNVRILDNARALRLFRDGDRITGVLLFEKQTNQFSVLEAKNVLLTSGGYAGIFPFTSNSSDISGDTVAMALLVGAHASDMEFVQFEPSCAVWPPSLRGKGMITTLFYEGAVMTNALGERFMFKHSPDGERVNKDVLARAIARELKEGRATEHGGVWFDTRGVDRERMLSAYAPFVNRYKNVGIDLFSEPVEVANAAHTSLGGVKVNSKCETDIAGLYAAGEAIGNLHGANRIGGSAGTETLVFGRHAAESIKENGKSSAVSVKEEDIGKLFSRPGAPIEDDRLKQMRAEAKDLLGQYLGVEREEEGLKTAIKALEELYKEVCSSSYGEQNATVFEQMSLENLLITALALAKSALLRDDSIGSHLRTDHKTPSENVYRTDVQIIGDEISVTKIHL